MKKFTDILNEKYVLNIEGLTNLIIENVNEPDIKNFKLKGVKKLLYISVDYAKSIDKLSEIGVKSYFFNPEILEFNLKNGNITLTSEKTTITISSKDAVDTVILMRSGYNNKNINFLLDEIKKLGIMVLNDTEAIKVSSDKFNTAKLLQNHKILTPKFVMIIKSDITIDDDKNFIKKLKTIYPKLNDDSKFVCKILGGHGGKGVFLCSYSNIKSIIQCIFAVNPEEKIIVQEFLKIKDGDIRVNVITMNGKQEIFNTTMRRKMTSDFRTNLSLGNKLDDTIQITDKQKEIALKCGRISGLTWVGVDLFPTEDGKTYVVELNGAPGPMSNLNEEDRLEENVKFYKLLIETINKLCK